MKFTEIRTLYLLARQTSLSLKHHDYLPEMNQKAATDTENRIVTTNMYMYMYTHTHTYTYTYTYMYMYMYIYTTLKPVAQFRA